MVFSGNYGFYQKSVVYKSWNKVEKLKSKYDGVKYIFSVLVWSGQKGNFIRPELYFDVPKHQHYVITNSY